MRPEVIGNLNEHGLAIGETTFGGNVTWIKVSLGVWRWDAPRKSPIFIREIRENMGKSWKKSETCPKMTCCGCRKPQSKTTTSERHDFFYGFPISGCVELLSPGHEETLHGGAGVMDYGNLIWITLQRSKTAREAILTFDQLVKDSWKQTQLAHVGYVCACFRDTYLRR